MTKKEQLLKEEIEAWVQDECLNALERYSDFAGDDEIREAFYCGIWGAYKNVCVKLGIPYPMYIEEGDVNEA